MGPLYIHDEHLIITHHPYIKVEHSVPTLASSPSLSPHLLILPWSSSDPIIAPQMYSTNIQHCPLSFPARSSPVVFMDVVSTIHRQMHLCF